METELVIRVSWTWGGSTIIYAHPTDLLSDVLSCHGFSPVPGSDLGVALRGRFVEHCFSLQFLQIQSGDHLHGLLKRQPSNEKSRRFLESLAPAKRRSQPVAVIDHSDANRRSQQARLSDLFHAQWEGRMDFNAFLIEMLERHAEPHKDVRSDFETRIPDLSQPRRISEDPLPRMFQIHGFTSAEVFKSDRDWRSGYVKEVSGKTKRGNFFDHLKK
jgi:hypothetical protein